MTSTATATEIRLHPGDKLFPSEPSGSPCAAPASEAPTPPPCSASPSGPPATGSEPKADWRPHPHATWTPLGRDEDDGGIGGSVEVAP